MTAEARRARHPAVLLALALVGLAIPVATASPLPEGLPTLPNLQPLVATDAQSGLALGGFDAVSYQAEGTPRAGSAKFELVHGGTVWRFASAANRAAFIEAPEVYVPAFGGLDPVALADERKVDGLPRFSIVKAGRLYLFASAETKKRFADDLVLRAEEAWVAVGERRVY